MIDLLFPPVSRIWAMLTVRRIKGKEDYQNCSVMLCNTIVHNHMRTDMSSSNRQTVLGIVLCVLCLLVGPFFVLGSVIVSSVQFLCCTIINTLIWVVVACELRPVGLDSVFCTRFSVMSRVLFACLFSGLVVVNLVGSTSAGDCWKDLSPSAYCF